MTILAGCDFVLELSYAALLKQLEANLSGRLRWVNERHSADWLQRDAAPVELPNLKDRMKQVFIGSRMFERPKPRK